MAKTRQPTLIDAETVYSVTLQIKGENLSTIMVGMPDDFSVEQAVLFRLFSDAGFGGFNARHFRGWHEVFTKALAGVPLTKVKKGQRLEPIPPLAPDPVRPAVKRGKSSPAKAGRKAAAKKKA